MRARRFMKGFKDTSNSPNGTNMPNNKALHRHNTVLKGVYRKESKVSSKDETIKNDQTDSSKTDSDVETLVFRPGVRVIIDI